MLLCTAPTPTRLPHLVLALGLALLIGCHQDIDAAQHSLMSVTRETILENIDPDDPVDKAQLQRTLATLHPQRPGVTDLYVVGFAGDASEDVFRNEALYLRQLFERRFGTTGRTVVLVNHPDNLGKQPYAPLATYGNLYETLARIGELMDPREDVLLLFLTTHGTKEHTLYVNVDNEEEDAITPKDLRKALDDAGIRNRVVVISACYSGGFIARLHTPDTLLLTATRADRSSFGCGNTSNATYFGQAWLIDGMNRTNDFGTAFEFARQEISAREHNDGKWPSLPQRAQGAHIGAVLAHWRAGIVPGPPIPYPYPPVAAAPTAR
ncbi:peptidase C13 [Xylella taiwanensis]|nr:C13 family peptidase [Xylella taiwanensis]MCD8456836.1 C13 family peptidase [Xylella taiwanensis]MCD8459245.1 C13 family peptidase [Xylella taiwanensis]MCD8461882.1 C13 family peptidase [Xylella taiwanensis]MCD8462087.1 C13 family peptidase [Xylella taiwanensis]MCD8465869.1 C13 family peptidase [Xylella taiwanensis]